MGNPKLAIKAEAEAKARRKYEEKLKQNEQDLLRLLAEAQAEYSCRLRICLQQSMDAALMAADDVFDVNAYSAEKFCKAMVQYVNDISSMIVEDSKSDPELVFTKTDLDRRIKQIVGAENFEPWDERYTGIWDI